IFDEVDAGIGGRVADVVGRRLRTLGPAFQVLRIAPLPQVAACADTHFRIDQRLDRGRTNTTVDRHSARGRVAAPPATLVQQAGFEATSEAADADLVVINTCSVRERAEEKLYTRLGELRELGAELGRDPVVAVAGCVAQQEGTAIQKRAPGVVDIIVGTQS